MSSHSPKNKFCFIHIPKNAGSSIRAALAQTMPDLFNFDVIDEKLRSKRDPALANHFPRYRIEELVNHPLVNYEMDPETRFFMVVRNPYERMVSLYHHRLRKLHGVYEGKPRNTAEDIRVAQQGFKPWLLNTPSEMDKVLTRKPQYDWGMGNHAILPLPHGSVTQKHPTEILHFETLTRDYVKMCTSLGIKPAPLGKAMQGTGEAQRYRSFYDDETRAHVETFFQRDLEAFNYEF